jgi:hypothetical protein
MRRIFAGAGKFVIQQNQELESKTNKLFAIIKADF